MNKQVKREWIKALRSGEYVQTTGLLVRVEKEGDSFCCLGVLCELAVQAGVVPRWKEHKDRRSLFIQIPGEAETTTAALPTAVIRWAGLDAYNPSIGPRDAWSRNDGGETFKEIADAIKAYL